MNNFKKEGFRKGGSSFGGKAKFGGAKKYAGPGRGHDRGHDRGERPAMGDKELFKTTCTACHKSCEVPFRPSSDKPVYCRECFAKTNAENDSRFGGRSESRGNDFRRDARPQRFERPSYQEDARPARDTSGEDMKRQFTKLEAKIDSILEILSRHSHTETTSLETGDIPTEEAPKKVRKPKTIKTKTKVKKVTKKKAK
jgi:CxxC-x17-CxxC domain-containing protein